MFIDRAKSGKDTNRPELQRMLATIKRGEITLLIVTELSRLSRSTKDFAGIWELMQKHDCQFMSLRENFDTTTAAGEMVLYSVANIAQFERRQVSERVSANFQARAERGLYNGGVLPIGFKLIPEKPGYLAIDDEQAQVVRAAFQALQEKKRLSAAAKWLNKQGHRIRRSSQVGFKVRLGHFTVDNLRGILTNPAYAGIRTYKIKHEVKETKAVWPAIVDEMTFQKTQERLKLNQKRKPESESRYPFLLSGQVTCQSCSHHMVGKSAHGNGGKISYYEHGWAVKRDGCLVQKALKCSPFRVQAKKLEPLVWGKVVELISKNDIAERLIREAEKIHAGQSKNSERGRIQSKVSTINSQIDVLSERLAELPKDISPEPIYRQLTRLQDLKREEESRLAGVEGPSHHDKPVQLTDYRRLLENLRTLGDSAKEQVIQTLINKVVVTPDGFNLHYFVGQGRLHEESLEYGSNRLTNGGPTRTRTWDQAVLQKNRERQA
ncbi:MAG: recombinase family protein [Oligoflexia bacterium]